MSRVGEARVRFVKESVKDRLIAQNDVRAVGVGQKNGRPVLVVGTEPPPTQATVTLPQAIPADVDVDFRQVGDLVAPPGPRQQTAVPDPVAQERTDRFRPVPMGVSVGHVDITAGTTGFLLTNGTEIFTGSNNHIYADLGFADPGDTIIQPGPADNGTAVDKVAEVADWEPIGDGALVDMAWATQTETFTNELLEVGVPQGLPQDPQVGDTIVKSGRTTGTTPAVVEVVHTTADVYYQSIGQIYTFEDQILTEPVAEGGDSGSAAVMRDTLRPAGALFAGSSSHSIFNYATNWESESGLSIVAENIAFDPSLVAVVDGTCSLSSRFPKITESVQLVCDVSNENPSSGAQFDVHWTADGTEFAVMHDLQLSSLEQATFEKSVFLEDTPLTVGSYETVVADIPNSSVVEI